MDDRSLLAAIHHGDSTAFWVLWQRHSESLSRLCLRQMHGNRADAEDALHQAMLKAFAKLPRFAAEILVPEAWLSRLTRNQCLDIHRERARAARLLGDLKHTDTRAEFRSVGEREGMATALRYIDALPERLRKPFVLHVIQRLPYETIAARLEQTAAGIRKRVQHARAALREMRDSSFRPPLARRQTAAAPPPPVARTSIGRLPGRARQKITTLRTYIHRHPGGWKMRLRLAELLYAAGSWAEAAESYRCVLRKRPALALRIGPRLDAIAHVLRQPPTTTTV